LLLPLSFLFFFFLSRLFIFERQNNPRGCMQELYFTQLSSPSIPNQGLFDSSLVQKKEEKKARKKSNVFFGLT